MSARIEKPVSGPYTCVECGAAKPDAETWPQPCVNCGNTIWRATVTFSREEIESAARD